MDNSLLAVRDINHKYIVVGGKNVNRIEKVREAVDAVLLNVADDAERRCGYAHLYGVSQACVLIALKRGENAELAATAGMLQFIRMLPWISGITRIREPPWPGTCWRP